MELLGYSYFYQTLIDWLIKQINTQDNFGPLEAVGEYLREAGCPKQMIISIGATRYTHYGESHFIQEGDEIVVVVYDNDLYCINPILMMANRKDLEHEGISALVQKVVHA